MAEDSPGFDYADAAAAPRSTGSTGRWLAITLAATVGGLAAGAGLTANLASRQNGPLVAEIERLKLEKTKAGQDLAAAQAAVEQVRTTANAEKADLLTKLKDKSAEADAARAAAEDANRKAADSERLRLAATQDKGKPKTDDAAKLAKAEADLKRAEAALKQKSAEVEQQKQAVVTARTSAAAAVAGAPAAPAGLTLHSLAGMWQGSLQGKTPSEGTIELTEQGKGLAGACTSMELCDGPNYTLVEATLQQNQLTLVFKYIYSIRYELTVSDDGTTMQGTWSHGDLVGGKHTGTLTLRKS